MLEDTELSRSTNQLFNNRANAISQSQGFRFSFTGMHQRSIFRLRMLPATEFMLHYQIRLPQEVKHRFVGTSQKRFFLKRNIYSVSSKWVTRELLLAMSTGS